MPVRVQTICFGLTLALCLPQAAAAFWPLDRNTRVITDSLSVEEWQGRFETWKQRPVGDAASVSDPMEEVRKAAQMGNIDPSLIARLAKQAREGTLPGQVAPAGPDAMPGSPGTPPSPSQPTAPRLAPDSSAAEGVFPGATAAGSSAKTTDPTTPATASGLPGASPPGPSASTAPPPSEPVGFADGDSLSGLGDGGAAFPDSVDAFGNPLPAPGGAAPGPFGNGRPPSSSSVLRVDRGFAPSLRAGLTSSNDRMRLDTSLSTSFSDVSGVVLSANLTHNQELRLSQGSENETNGLTMSLNAPIRRAGLSFGISAGGNRRSSLGARTVTTARTSDRSENRLAQLSANFARPIQRGFDFNAYYSRNFTADEQTIAATSSAGQGERSTQTTGNSFGAGVNVERLRWVKLRGSFGRNVDSRLFRSPSFVTPDNPSGETKQPSEGDTVTVRAEMPIGRYVPQLSAEFQVRRSEYSYTDVTRTSSGGIQSATDFAVETESRFSRTFRMQGSLEPLRFLSANFSYEVARDSVSAILRTTLFEDAKRQRWTLGSTLRTPWKGEIRVKYTGTLSDINKDEPTNPENPQTRRDESREMSGEILQSFTQTLKVRAYGSVSLAQGFYAHEGPTGAGDRDDSRAQLGLDLDGRISGKATARVQMYVRSFDQAFIDRRRSKDSRDETEYVVRQSFNYQITPQILLRQFYGLSSKVVDEIFDPNGDTLNRNHFLQTSMNYQMTSRLTLDARLDYRLQDNGFYIQASPRSVERIFAATARTKTNEVGLGMRYALIRNNKLTFVSDQVATREYRTSFFSGRPTGTNVTNRGNLGLGLESKITLNDLSLDASVRRNQSFNVSLNRAVYYDVRSSLSYTF